MTPKHISSMPSLSNRITVHCGFDVVAVSANGFVPLALLSSTDPLQPANLCVRKPTEMTGRLA